MSPAAALLAATDDLAERRMAMLKGRLMLSALQRKKDKDGWRNLPKSRRDEIIRVLNLARQVESDLELNTEDYGTAIKALEALAMDRTGDDPATNGAA